AKKPAGHGTTVTGILAAHREEAGMSGFLRALDDIGPGFDVIVDRGSDGGITANIAASVNLVEDGARLIKWSWGLHRAGTIGVAGDAVGSLIRSGIAMSGEEALLAALCLWLRAEHPDLIAVHPAGPGATRSSQDDCCLPTPGVRERLLAVGGPQLCWHDS